MVANGFVWCCFCIPFCLYWCRLRVSVPAPVWYFPGKFIPLHRQNENNMNVQSNPAIYENADRMPGANFVSAERLQVLTEELDALAVEYKRNEILTLQMKVQGWAIRFNRWPRALRPLCLRNFKKWAKRYNAVVCSLYPPAPGAPSPVEEIVNNIEI